MHCLGTIHTPFPVFCLCLQIGMLKALLDTASGLDYLHAMGVVHGDLKTANVLLKGSAEDARGFVCKLADFGLSRVLDMGATHLSTKYVHGKGWEITQHCYGRLMVRLFFGHSALH